MHDKIRRVALEREALLLGGLAPEELDTLVVVLQKLNARVGLVNAYEPSEG
ncbi:hypothetical protein [Marinomonas transparens]|uniref:Uncharacterized protein n=1 Tax=Marinomonas transparens TaxID=2795388 RepID=A0A934N360_9GAMM|nr:hypothetical protein [Marinomonas transparens]MBJ7538628.1 hypothetical protein [Marinomonas transparens]